MALKKEITLPSGVRIEYARIDSVVYRRRERIVEIQLGGYVDKEHSDAGAHPVTNIGSVVVEGDDAEAFIAALHDVAGPLVYEAAKNTPQFADAEDV